MKVFTFILALFTLLTLTAHAQTNCVSLGQFLSCDSARGNSTQLQLNKQQGVIVDSQGNIEPYLVLPAPQPSRPLHDTLPTLPTLQPSQPVQPADAFSLTPPLFLQIGGDGSQ